ncbi:MAG: hypothetical protein J6Q53_09095 [Oscillospiraceae bacterium]|nr:hypothetical protein [Oscillospiraceae bacterium]
MNKKTFSIYALINDQKVYVGKTKGKRISAVFSYHRNGKNASTRTYFVKPAPAPECYLLRRSEMRAFEAYKWVLVYIRMFRDADYEILNCPRSIERSDNLKEDTQRIWAKIKSTSISELLLSTRIEKLTDADIAPIPQTTRNQKAKSTQTLTLRLTKDEKVHFQEIGANLNLNQHETLLYLFDKCNQSDPFFMDLGGDSYLRSLFDCQREEIKKLENANSKLSETIVAIQERERQNLKSARKMLVDIRTVVSAYFALMENSAPIPLEIECGLYRNNEYVENYKYPDNAGVYLIRPQMVLRGNGRYSALFILGIAGNDEHYKFRYYPKKTYIGVPIPDSPFAVRGSLWLVACKESKDGAKDLYCSFPLTVTCPKQLW